MVQEALSLGVWEGGGVKGRNDTHALVWLWLCLKRLRCSDRSVARQLRGERVWENGRGIRGKTNQRSQPGERDRREIHQQMASGGALCTPLPESGFLFRLWPAFSQTLDQFLHAGRFAPGPDHLQCLFQLWPGRQAGPSGMQKDQIRVASPSQRGFCPNPIDSSLLVCNFSRRLCF